MTNADRQQYHYLRIEAGAYEASKFHCRSDARSFAISYVEVLGYHKLTPEERQDLESFFAATQLLTLSDAVLAQAVHLRQQRKMTLVDSLVGASAIVFQHTLVTRNTSDFSWIDGLPLLDPVEVSA